MDPREAAQYGNVERLQQLLDSGAITPDWTDSDDCSLLHWAAINNRLHVAELLLRRRANVNAVGGVLASTPLHWAARQGHVLMVAFLVTNGAQVEKRDVEGFTPLHVAAQFGATPVVGYLIARGQSVDAPDESRITPAMWAAAKCPHVDPLQLLITLGADVNKADAAYHNTPLHWAATNGNVTAVNTLLKADCDLSATNRDNETALDIAVRRGDTVLISRMELAARRKGLMNSTWRQRLTEDKTNSRRILWCAPFFIYSCIWLILHLNTSLSIKLAYLLLTAIICGKKSWHLAKFNETYFRVCYIKVLQYRPIGFNSSISGNINKSYIDPHMVFLPTAHIHMKQFILLTGARGTIMKAALPPVNYLWKEAKAAVVLLSCCHPTAVILLRHWRDICGAHTLEDVIMCDHWLLFAFIVAAAVCGWSSAMTAIQFYQILMEVTTNERLNIHRYSHFQVGTHQLDIRSPYK
ncbi:ankyrin repeat protein [Ancylostoma ceylanicum]|uniref:Ankyrin repeat protein n=1 Tax=Ancylostoma ceylanicum TaxID=53326 RepID=A0A0D6M9T6_9BILA|nr:ankyrin repeat protein [Ancylostoma ceylanicum]